MLDRIGIWLMRALEVVFFTGLIGCALVVMLSWVSILNDVLSDDEGDHHPN